MKIISIFLGLGCLLLIISCGSGDNNSSLSGGGTTNSNPNIPSISNLTISPPRNQGGGTTAFSLTFNFTDLGGNLSSVTVFAYDANGNVLAMNTTPLQGLSGQTTGTITSTLVLSTVPSGTFYGGVYIADAGGLQSNRLSAPITVS